MNSQDEVSGHESATRWIDALLACASSTNLMIWDSAVSRPTWVGFEAQGSGLLTVPPITLAPMVSPRGWTRR